MNTESIKSRLSPAAYRSRVREARELLVLCGGDKELAATIMGITRKSYVRVLGGITGGDGKREEGVPGVHELAAHYAEHRHLNVEATVAAEEYVRPMLEDFAAADERPAEGAACDVLDRYLSGDLELDDDLLPCRIEDEEERAVNRKEAAPATPAMAPVVIPGLEAIAQAMQAIAAAVSNQNAEIATLKRTVADQAAAPAAPAVVSRRSEEDEREIEAARALRATDRGRDNRRLLCVSDMHKPYGHPDTLDFLAAVKRKHNPTRILIGGDELDHHGMNFHGADPDLDSAGPELEKGRRELWEVAKLFPEADVLHSNHGSMAYRRAKHGGMPRHLLLSYKNAIFGEKDANGDLRRPGGRGDGWNWHPKLLIAFPNGMEAEAVHGYAQDVLTAVRKAGCSIIQFHHHTRFDVRYTNGPGGLRWGMTCSCLIDNSSLAYDYNKVNVEWPITGVGLVEDGIPRLLPMLLDRHGRWTGYVP